MAAMREQFVFTHMQTQHRADRSGPFGMLSAREHQVAALACKGLSNKAIARSLNVGEGTIKAHLHAILAKLRLRSRYELLIVFDRFRSS